MRTFIRHENLYLTSGRHEQVRYEQADRRENKRLQSDKEFHTLGLEGLKHHDDVARRERLIPYQRDDTTVQFPDADPCLPAVETTVMNTYHGTSLSPRDVAFDRSWNVCKCDQYTHDAEPDGDCEVCYATGVKVWGDYCPSCAPGEEHGCATCLGTGLDFLPRRTNQQYSDEAKISLRHARQQAEIEYYLGIAEAEGMLQPAEVRDEKEGRFALRMVVLESRERVPCKWCPDDHIQRAYEREGRKPQPCAFCNAIGSHPALRENWLCSVDLNSEYQDEDGHLHYGRHWPQYLPTERYVPYHISSPAALRSARKNLAVTIHGAEYTLIPTRPWRTRACGCSTAGACRLHPVTITREED